MGGKPKPKKKLARPVSRTPLKGQAVKPCVDGETELYGSCWLKIADQSAPCPPNLYQEGNSCYAPSVADTPEPASETRDVPETERR
jgi:hypothetical protein